MRFTTFCGLGLLGGLLSSCQPDATAPGAQPPADRFSAEKATTYIVVYKPNVVAGNSTTSGQANAPGARTSATPLAVRQLTDRMLTQAHVRTEAVAHVYAHTLTGFAAQLTPEQAQALRSDARVAYLEPDQTTTLTYDVVNEAGARSSARQETPWGVTAVGGFVNYAGPYVAWIVDSGIDLDHPDLTVDAQRGFNAFKTGTDSKSLNDGNGHGTHVAGTIAAKNNTVGVVGIAAGATVIPVKVIDAGGNVAVSNLLAGLDYVAANAKSGDVVNLSLSIDPSPTVDNAVLGVAAKGVFVSMSAGNAPVRKTTDANLVSPGRVNGPGIYTASIHNQKGEFNSFSCSGNPPIDFAAPGVSIRSTSNRGGYVTFYQGTTMAAAHVSGILLANGGTVYAKGYITRDRDGNPDPKASRVP